MSGPTCPRCQSRPRLADGNHCGPCKAALSASVMASSTRNRPRPGRTRGFAQAVVVFVDGREITDT